MLSRYNYISSMTAYDEDDNEDNDSNGDNYLK